MKKKTKPSIFTITMIGSTQVGGLSHGRFQPPKKIVTIRPETTTTLRYSAAKNAAKRPPPYSVLKPPTSSASASERSNGARLVSAKPASRKMMKPKNCGTRNSRWLPCHWTMSTSDSDPVIMITPASDRPCATSLEISCAAERIEPRNEYFEPEAQPPSIRP